MYGMSDIYQLLYIIYVLFLLYVSENDKEGFTGMQIMFWVSIYLE